MQVAPEQIVICQKTGRVFITRGVYVLNTWKQLLVKEVSEEPKDYVKVDEYVHNGVTSPLYDVKIIKKKLRS